MVPGDGRSPAPLAAKLGIGPGHVVLLDRPPPEWRLETPPGAVVTGRLREGLDLCLTFQTRRARLERRLPELEARTTTAGAVWVAWPKRAAVARGAISTDLDDRVVREVGLETGWVDVKVAAVDDTWSALKFVRRRADR